MKIGDKVVVISGLFHGYRGEIFEITKNGNLLVALLNEDFGWEFKPFELELEEREDLYRDLI
jgi:transcription antitermination factor NusG